MNYTPPVSDKLGNQPVVNFMTKKVVSASAGTTIETAIKMMLAHRISGVPVCDEHGRCVGLYSELDAMIQGAGQPLSSPIQFSKVPLTVPATQTFREVLILMVKRRFRRLPIVDESGRLVGIVSRHDLIKALFESEHKK